MTTQPSARERVLAAYEDLLINDGPRAATLDAVAAAAGVSKGGLLYHFKSKEALTEGLLGKLAELAAVDFELMANDPEGCASYYVRTSVFGGTVFDRCVVAAMRLAQGEDSTVRAAFLAMHATWYRLILEDIGDPAVARAVMLLGDGLYFNAALFGLPTDAKNDGGTQDAVDVQSLLAVVRQLRSSVRA
ncbi:AcrR family transcriptional regulator [Arthrobacter silviterrae]|uniref:TetR/AcrR family transcriptional regulator n=1 Tax=Arthrobacter silviterrae TaxID=2026658 RepID=A0ABX0DJ64_9MICC|nr:MULTISPECIES: TetR/AcrR family transcriptional regulator [Arthrobacter]MDQ0277675.1 AcrR family transcriptional regulator [Arthrobacter silviterrae]NGN84272.1 TetR/AcrR family transcriptional regulator [Arthrobacter silviterrae]